MQLPLTKGCLRNVDTLILPHIYFNLETSFLVLTPAFSSVQSLSCVWLFATPWTAPCQASLSITNCQSLLKLMSIESVMPSNHLILCLPLLLLPSIFPSIRVFSNVSALRIRWPKYWSFSFSISPSNEYSGLISFRMDWLDTVLWTLSGRVGRDWRDLAHTHMRVPLLIPRATLTLSPHPQKKSNTMYQRNPRGLEHRAWCFLDHQGNSHPGWVLVVRRKLRCSRITTDQKWGGPASSSCSAPN